jgi:hypothetical protein
MLGLLPIAAADADDCPDDPIACDLQAKTAADDPTENLVAWLVGLGIGALVFIAWGLAFRRRDVR